MKQTVFKSLLLLVVACGFSATALGQAVNNVEINQIWVGAYSPGGEATVRIFTDSGTFTTCDRSDAFVITSGPLSSAATSVQKVYFDQQYSLLLASLQAGKSVSLWTSGCTVDGKFTVATRVSSD